MLLVAFFFVKLVCRALGENFRQLTTAWAVHTKSTQLAPTLRSIYNLYLLDDVCRSLPRAADAGLLGLVPNYYFFQFGSETGPVSLVSK